MATTESGKKKGRGRDFPDTRVAVLEALQDPERFVIADEPDYGRRIDYDDDKHEYRINGIDVPSVTQILDATRPKPALTWWGFRVGLASAVRLLHEHRLTMGRMLAMTPDAIIKPALFLDDPDVNHLPGKTPKHVIEAEAISLRSTPNHIKEDKGTIGTSVHKAAESLGITGAVPDLNQFPFDDQGYIVALAKWVVDQEPEFKHLELIVGSPRLGFAGRFDAIVELRSGMRYIVDYKTSGGIYSEYDVQLALYDIGYHDMGLHVHPEFGPIEGHLIVWLQPDGNYEQIHGTGDYLDALTEILAFQQRRDHVGRVKDAGRKA